MLADWVDIGLKVFVTILLPIGGLCLAIWVRINRIVSRVDQIDRDIAKMPSATALNELKIQIEELRGETRVLGERIDGFSDALRRNGDVIARVEQYLLDNSRKK